MAKLVFGMNLSLDGFVDHERFAPDNVLFRHWIEHVQGLAGSLYGRRIYEIMRYWETDDPAWTPAHHEFADAWRRLPKWVASRTLGEVGPNATLLGDDPETEIRELKARLDGELTVAGPYLARSLAERGLIDEYRLYYHPVVLGEGKPFFDGFRPAVRFKESERIGENVIRLTFFPV